MNVTLRSSLWVACAAVCVAVPAAAADRVRAGQWDTTLEMLGRSVSRSACISQSDAHAINGDAKSIKAYVEKVSASAGCRVTDVKIGGALVSVTTACAAGKENVGTTTYPGDSSETVNTNGARSQSKRVGACR